MTGLSQYLCSTILQAVNSPNNTHHVPKKPASVADGYSTKDTWQSVELRVDAVSNAKKSAIFQRSARILPSEQWR